MRKLLFILVLLSTQFGYGKWEKSSFEATSNLHEVAFPSEDAAYIAGGYGKIYKSTDQGSTWTEIHDFGVFSQVEDMFFINADTGFVNIYNSQHRTTDGGLSWTHYGFFDRVKAVRDTLYATIMIQDTVYIKRSVDLGETWTTLFEKYELNSQSYRFSVVDAEHAYFINPKELDRVYKTTNGFSSIDTLFIRHKGIVLQDEFDYKDHEYGFLYGSWGAESHPTRTWNTGDFYYPIDLDGFGVLPVFDIDFKADIIYASSLYGKIYSSTNNGLNWKEHLTPSNDPILSIAFYDKDNGIAVTENGVLYTSTGGELLGFGNEPAWASDISIYPNPTENILTIESPGFSEKHIEVYAMSGMKVQSMQMMEERTQIDLRNYPSGIYFISITTSGEKVTRKVVKR